jgi:LacI family transcriptional regulator
MTSDRITSHDVAREAGVSQATVSRALRGDRQISARTIARVRQIADTLGYVPSSLGRSLSRRTTGQIAVVAELGNLTYPDTVPVMHDELALHGYRMVLVSEPNDRELDHEILFDGSVDGVILTTTRLDSTLPARLHARRIPFVFLNRTARGVVGDSVTADNAGGARAVAQLLLGDGHRTIAMLSGPTDMSSAVVRERAFAATLREAGIEPRNRPVIRRELVHESGRLGWGDLMSMRERPTAVFCGADAVAVGLLNAIAEHGDSARRPAVVGFDNSPISAWPVFSLTTVDTHLREMARQATQLLVERLEITASGADVPPRKVVVPTTLTLRSSHVGG